MTILKRRTLAGNKNAANCDLSPVLVSQNLTRRTVFVGKGVRQFRSPFAEECPIFDCLNLQWQSSAFPVSFPLCSIRKLLNWRDISSVPTVPG
jgi:hypothetical protein